ncbi:1,8-cineole synthase, chloroplast precursor, putative [Ricinus communis]|uniref:Probable terpene synthase 4 n=2 Tax=Ricinus communis TaxID=3988 RepID=TPS4_RICCO|nr:RecName: Full=Probable terpene synthase 4; Short=RcSeTPS4 [Ricinus communis]EEF48749.1 1,8-cineole synthase, chloroplast precursor, putative [Ricinus communis]|eukprot:XP_002513346.1 probable terpene synthase 4 [Ricinus communis]
MANAISNPASFIGVHSPIAQIRIPRLCVAKGMPTPIAQRDIILQDQIQLENTCIRHAKALKEARLAFSKVRKDHSQNLIMIDALQRLGIDYHFQEETQDVLEGQYNKIFAAHQQHHLSDAALRFRLLRQQGYYVPASDVFSELKNREGKFKQELAADIKGLMELYEASQLSIQEENILDEAGAFSAHFLNCWTPHLCDHQTRIVSNTLKHPFHRTLARSTIKNFLHFYNFQGENEYIQTFTELAKLDFNMIQSIHRQEINQVSNWWNNLGLASELKFARDQPEKWCMWPLVGVTDPSLSWQRIELAKPVSLVYLIDDIFDLGGTPDQLTLFTEAVNRWEITATEDLPYHMKICFRALYDVTNQIAYKVYKKHQYNPIHSLKKAWARLCNAFLEEAKWFAAGKLPKADEYLNTAIVTSGVHLVLVHTFFLMGDGITDQTINLLNNDDPGIISSVATILRLWDDLGSAQDENQDGYDGSYIECYMKDFPGTSVRDARNHVISMISDTWKKLNQHCLSPNPFSGSFIRATLNGARMVPLMYDFDSNHNLPILQQNIKSLLFESVAI